MAGTLNGTGEDDDDSIAAHIAVIGMSCRFAGDAKNPEAFWDLLADGRNAWSEVPSSRFDQSGVYHPNGQRTSTTNVRGAHFLEEDLGLFDAAFFSLSTETATTLDPQIRLQLESAYEAFENAGLSLASVAGSRTSVYAATTFGEYSDAMMRDGDLLPRTWSTGAGPAMVSNRISHFFDLRGPCMTLNTGCSSSLIGVHQAVQSLRSRETDMSLVGGSNLILGADVFKSLGSLGLLSPDGKCYSFDSRANGYGRGEGVATLVLKRLRDAIADGDSIRAVLRETCSNQDGKTKTITSPSQSAQEALIRECYRKARHDPRETDYFEAHGTGTKVGDAVEASAVASVFASLGGQRLRMGSVKGNIGHTEATSGLAAILKTVLALEKGLIPPSANFEKPNPKLALDKWNLRIMRELEPWNSVVGRVRYASVNNFGYGGSNVHALLSEAPDLSLVNGHVYGHEDDDAIGREGTSEKVLVLSANDEHTLKKMIGNVKEYLEHRQTRNPHALQAFLESLVYTLGSRRTLLPWVATQSIHVNEGLVKVIENLDPSTLKVRHARTNCRIGMVFTGQGAQWHAMGRELLSTYPSFKASIIEAAKYLQRLGASWSLVEELNRDQDCSNVNDTALSVPICVAVQISLVKLLRAWNISPTAVTSHSSGEIAAAYTVGAISFRCAMGIAYYRGALVASTRSTVRGGMAAIALGEEETQELIDESTSAGEVVVACLNSPSSTTISGDLKPVSKVVARAQQNGTFARQLKVDVAFHSHHMAPVADAFATALEDVFSEEERRQGALKDPIYSSPVTGYLVLDKSELSNPQHWVDSLVQPVLFADAFTKMILAGSGDSSVDVLVEVGPHPALNAPVRQILESPIFEKIAIPCFSTLARDIGAVESIQALAANLLCEGAHPNLQEVNFPTGKPGHLRPLTDLPPYPWNHQRKYWYEPRINRALRERNRTPHDLLGLQVPGRRPSTPTWRQMLSAIDTPWVKDHVIQSDMVFTGAGYMCLALEAMAQLLQTDSKGLHSLQANKLAKSLSYHLHDVVFHSALVVPESSPGVEVQTMLRPATHEEDGEPAWKHFDIYSVTHSGQWTLHATGSICAELQQIPLDERVLQHEWTGYVRHIDPGDLWATMRSAGFHHGPSFRNISSIVQDGKTQRARSTVVTPNLSGPADSRSELILHPATLDTLVTTTYAALHGIESGQSSTRIPRRIEDVWISASINNEPGHQFGAYTHISHATPQSIEADISVRDSGSDTSGNVVLRVRGLSCRSLGSDLSSTQTAQTRNSLCSTLRWAPDLSLPTTSTFDRLKSQLDWTNDRRSDLPRSTSHAAQLLRTVLHKNPRARILEIGAGAGSATREMLETVGNAELGEPLASSYHMTCKSGQDLASARAEFANRGDLLAFSKLDIERNPVGQGFALGSHDVIIAHEIVHTSRSVAKGLANIRSLLKSGGTLLLIESNALTSEVLTDTACTGETGNLRAPSMHSDSWDCVLRDAGFSGVDMDVHDSAGESTSTIRTILSTTSDGDFALPNDGIVLVTSKRSSPSHQCIHSLQASIAAHGKEPAIYHLESEASSPETYIGKFCVFIDQEKGSLLADLNEESLKGIKTLATHCKGLLWVTRGGAIDCEVPEAAMAAGFLRALRNEYVGRHFVHLDIDPNATADLRPGVEAITSVLKAIVSRTLYANLGSEPIYDYEYAERGGSIFTPRWYRDTTRDQFVSPGNCPMNKISTRPIESNKAPLQLRADVPGQLRSLAFGSTSLPGSQGYSDDIPEDFVEVEPQAYGINAADVSIAIGTSHNRPIGFECSGVVTRAGTIAAQRGFARGDRVFCYAPGQLSTLARLPWTHLERMPTDLSWEEAAVIPTSFSAAYMSLVDVARAQPGDTTLIRAEECGFRQAAVQLALVLGLSPLVTVDSLAEKTLMCERYGVEPDNIIISAGGSNAVEVLGKTRERGIDIIIHDDSPSLLKDSLACLGETGHLVYIDSPHREPLGLPSLSGDVTFTRFDLAQRAQHRPAKLQRALSRIAELLARKAIRPVYPLTTYRISNLLQAFQAVQDGTHPGRAVVTVGPKDAVPIVQDRFRAELCPDASYLIVGGPGSLGRPLAYWMADHGARNIILVSRHAESNEKAIRLVSELQRSDGCRVKLLNCNVSDSSSLAEMIQKCKEDGLPPIRGVVQAAADIQASILEHLELAEYTASILPKVRGTNNLIAQLVPTKLDFFIMLSSFTGVIGMASQGSYSAGGAFLDATAHHLRAKGFPAVSIDLGGVKSIGYVAEQRGVGQRLQKLGIGLLSDDQVLRAFESALMLPQEPQVIVGLHSAPGRHWDPHGESQLGRDARFSALQYRRQGSAEDGAQSSTQSLTSQLEEASSPDAARELVAGAIAAKLAASFALSVDDMDLTKHPGFYGVDSLIAVDLRRMLVQTTGVEVSIFDIAQSQSLHELADKIVSKGKFGGA